jgi:hypothetical protein
MEMEAPFNAVRLLRINRSATSILNGSRALVGVTESNDFAIANGLTLSQNLSLPVYSVGGTPTAYNQLAPAGTVNGFQPVSWPGVEIVSLANTGTVATMVTKKPHGLVTGNTITIRGTDVTVFNVTAAAITLVDSLSFTFPIASDPATAVKTLGSYSANATGVDKTNVDQTYVISNKVALKSRESRLDGGTRPLLVYRFYQDGTAAGFPFVGLQGATRLPTDAMRGRTIQVGAALEDGVGNFGWNFGLDNVLMDVFPIVSYNVPVLSVWDVGDSTHQNDGLVTDKVSSWVYRACMSVSTPQRPVIPCNFGASSQTSATYWAQAKNALAAGVPPPSILIVGVDSVNDGGVTDATVQNAFALATDVMATAQKYGIPEVIFTNRMPSNSLNTAQYAAKLKQEQQISDLANSYSVKCIFLGGMGDGANPERWIPALNYATDGVHPNELAIETVLTPQLINIFKTRFGL